jgi:hypothetical protein
MYIKQGVCNNRLIAFLSDRCEIYSLSRREESRKNKLFAYFYVCTSLIGRRTRGIINRGWEI